MLEKYQKPLLSCVLCFPSTYSSISRRETLLRLSQNTDRLLNQNNQTVFDMLNSVNRIIIGHEGLVNLMLKGSLSSMHGYCSTCAWRFLHDTAIRALNTFHPLILFSISLMHVSLSVCLLSVRLPPPPSTYARALQGKQQFKGKKGKRRRTR